MTNRQREYYQRNRYRAYWIQVRRLYRVEKEDVVALFVKQNSICPVCSRRITFRQGKFTIDHCHRTGKVRGVLHKGCNTGIGLLKDSPEILRRAADYLEENGP